MTDWRTIMARDIDWDGLYTGASSAGTNGIKRAISQNGGWDYKANVERAGDWFEYTLGEVANLGRVSWLRMPNVGKKAADFIEYVIDIAAEGKPVLRGPIGLGPNAYIPKIERAR